MNLKALSLWPEFAIQVLLGYKRVECRSWQTDHRGQLLICSSAKPLPLTIDSHALAVVDIVDVVHFTNEHLEASCLEKMPVGEQYAWILGRVDWIEPFTIKGKQRLFDVEDSLIKVLPETISSRECLERYYEPLLNFGDNGASPENKRIWKEIVSSF